MDEPIFQTGNFKTSEIAKALGGHPAPAQRYAVFRGYLFGPVKPADKPTNAPKGVYLLYVNDEFTQWLTIKVEDLMGQVTMPVNALDARDKVWVKHDAVLTQSFSGAASCIEEVVGSASDPGGGPTKPPGPPY